MGRYEDLIGDIQNVDEIHFHYLDAPDPEAPVIRPVHITAIGEILEDGLVISCIRIEYSGLIEAGLLKPAHFQTPGRCVIRTYTNNTGNRGEAERKGKYLFLELLINTLPDSNEYREIPGIYRYGRDSPGWTVELPLVIAVRQIDTVFTSDGKKIPPFNSANDSQYIENADEMVSDSYINTCDTYIEQKDNITIRYNLYIPPGYEEKKAALENIPLVFFLHGAGESGHDNRAPVTSYRQALEFVRERGGPPCFIMIPQCPVTLERDGGLFEEYGWFTYIKNADGVSYTHPSKSLKAALNALLEKAIPRYNIDASRIYAAGHSMGAGGALMALIEKPGTFAAALSFSTAAVLSEEMIKRLKDKPIFFTMAEDDEWDIIRNNMPVLMKRLEAAGIKVLYRTGESAWDGGLRGEAAETLALMAVQQAREAEASVIYAEYLKGTVVPQGHLSHRASFANAGIRAWLLEQHL